MNSYIVGQVVFLRARLSDPSTGDASDPATQTAVDDATEAITVYKPDGSVVNTSVSHVSTGVYTTSITVDQDGDWVAVSLSSGAAAGAGRDRFYVAPVP